MSQSDRTEFENVQLRQLRLESAELRDAHASGDRNAFSRIREHHPRFAGLDDDQIRDNQFVLADAELVIARERDFESWPRLKRYFDGLLSDQMTMHEAVTVADGRAYQAVYEQDAESIHELDRSGNPPLYTAALYRNAPARDFLIEKGAEIDIFASAYLDRPDVTKTLLLSDSSLVDAKNTGGVTPLHLAARRGSFAVAEELLRHGADVNAVDDRGNTPLLEASHGGPWKDQPAKSLIELLLRTGAHVDVHSAAAMGDVQQVETLLDEDPTRLNERDRQGHTPLFLAAKNNRIDVVMCLVERGADVNASDAVGIATLHRMSQECSDELIRYLIDRGANAHLCCHVACGDEAGTRALLSRDPNAVFEDYLGFVALDYAIHCWKTGPLRILLEYGCKLTEEDRQNIRRISTRSEELLEEFGRIEDDASNRNGSSDDVS